MERYWFRRVTWVLAAVLAGCSAYGPGAVPVPPPRPGSPATSTLATSVVVTTTAATVPTSTTPTSTTSTVPISVSTAPPEPPRAMVQPCPLPEATAPPIDGDAVTAATALVGSMVCATTDVVVASAAGDATRASQAAAAMGAPLVLADPGRPYDPAGLGAARAWTSDPALVVSGPHTVLPLPRRRGTLPGLLAGSPATGEVPDQVVAEVLEGTAPADPLLVVSSRRADLGAVAAATAAAVGGAAVWARPGDMRRRRDLGALAAGSSGRYLLGDFAAASAWQLDVLAGGTQLPGGGQVLFPGRRLVAMYGHPHTPRLGILGEQPVEAAVARAAELALPYGGDVPVIPTFEIIATTASASPGSDGDYSAELAVEELRPWVEAAAAAGFYVVLDLQPGRTDFLTQARRYEELLKLPHVGLALDPEWRLASGQRHLRQIGSVTAAEVNQVAGWLAEMVRRERLPQKLLLVHQFKLSMITDRQELAAPSELAIVIQMDGQGPLGTKYATWDAILHDGSERWHWGWKNFYDEDSPMATPEQVLDLEPVPVFVSYQ